MVAAPYPSLYLSYLIGFPFNELRLALPLLLGLGIGYGGLDHVFRSVSGGNNGGLTGLRER